MPFMSDGMSNPHLGILRGMWRPLYLWTNNPRHGTRKVAVVFKLNGGCYFLEESLYKTAPWLEVVQVFLLSVAHLFSCIQINERIKYTTVT
jgi:hypothetical protein